MENDSQSSAFLKIFSASANLLFLVIFFPLTAIAHPTGTMGGHMMDEETREKMMEQGGQGYGPGYGRMGNMMGGGYGHMMGGGPGWMGGMMGMMGGGYGHMMGGFNQLDLSKGQRDKIRKIQFAMHKENLGLMEKMMERSSRLAELYDSDNLDTEKIGKAYDVVYKVRREIILRHVEARNKIFNVLDEKQRKQFRSSDSYGHMGMMMH